MPLQNRVNPYGAIVATPERGNLLGNRGVLHNSQQQIVRPYALQRWICCLLEFRGRHRQVMQPNRWTELFFLDEATAFAAGHRPCFECRNPAAKAFQTAWATAGVGSATAGAIDAVLEHDRKRPDGTKKTYTAPVTSLPNGTFIADKNGAWLVLDGQCYPWSFSGYGAPRPAGSGKATVLTPKATVAVLKNGYQVGMHPSASALP